MTMTTTKRSKKQKLGILDRLLKGAKKIAEAAAETKKAEDEKLAWQRKDCGTPC